MNRRMEVRVKGRTDKMKEGRKEEGEKKERKEGWREEGERKEVGKKRVFHSTGHSHGS